MSKLDTLKEIIDSLRHTDECKGEYIGDGLPCNCGVDLMKEGLETLMKKLNP